ncbi:trypsin alpha-like [Musca domestica]|uniref:Trypsin alpha-like n=1 Tax=Musca domestica TaxID=7370 RepID=A0A1I8MR37_MUSDO|nr:trypsin alpha-like [Musca domestica]
MQKLIFFALLIFAIFIEENNAKRFRIVNGKNGLIENFPFQLSLRLRTIHICGASVLSDSWAITAAHCVHDVEHTPREVTLRMGSTWRTRDGVIVPVQQIHTHPSYNAETMNFDVSLLKVRENTFHRPDLYVKPIKLPGLSEKIPNNSVATVSGWGHQSSSDHNLSYQLKYTLVFTVDQVECNNSLRIHGGVSNAMFCAAARSTDACQGDSGGPIQINGILVGVVSWGVGCADPYYPGVYTRLAYAPIRFWIKLLTKL